MGSRRLAKLLQALDKAEGQESAKRLAEAHWQLATHYDSLDYTQAVSHYKSALANGRDPVASHRAIGDCMSARGSHDEALDHYTQYLALAAKARDPIEEQRALTSIGNARHALARDPGTAAAERSVLFASALENYAQSLASASRLRRQDLISQSEKLQMVSKSSFNIANVHWDLGQLETALEGFQKSLELGVALKDWEMQMRAHQAISELEADRGHPALAVQALKTRMAVAVKCADREIQADCCLSLAEAARRDGDHELAHKWAKKARQIARTAAVGGVGVGVSEETQERVLAAYRTSKRDAKLRADVRGCLAELERGGLENARAAALHEELGDRYCELQERRAAIDHYQQAIPLGPSDLAAVFYSIGITYQELDDHAKALPFFERELAQHEATGNEGGQARAAREIAHSLNDAGLSVERVAAAYKRAEALVLRCLAAAGQAPRMVLEVAVELFQDLAILVEPHNPAKAHQHADRAGTLQAQLDALEDAGAEADVEELATSDSEGEDDEENQESTARPARAMKTKAERRNAQGESDLQVAVIRGDLDRVRRLIALGANVNNADNAGWTPLHEACNHGFTDIVKELLKHEKIRINHAGGVAGGSLTPLHDAVQMREVEVVKLLVSHGASLIATDSRGWTPLHYAARVEAQDLFDYLKAVMLNNGHSLPLQTMADLEEDSDTDSDGAGIRDKGGGAGPAAGNQATGSALASPAVQGSARPGSAAGAAVKRKRGLTLADLACAHVPGNEGLEPAQHADGDEDDVVIPPTSPNSALPESQDGLDDLGGHGGQDPEGSGAGDWVLDDSWGDAADGGGGGFSDSAMDAMDAMGAAVGRHSRNTTPSPSPSSPRPSPPRRVRGERPQPPRHRAGSHHGKGKGRASMPGRLSKRRRRDGSVSGAAASGFDADADLEAAETIEVFSSQGSFGPVDSEPAWEPARLGTAGSDGGRRANQAQTPQAQAGSLSARPAPPGTIKVHVLFYGSFDSLELHCLDRDLDWLTAEIIEQYRGAFGLLIRIRRVATLKGTTLESSLSLHAQLDDGQSVEVITEGFSASPINERLKHIVEHSMDRTGVLQAAVAQWLRPGTAHTANLADCTLSQTTFEPICRALRHEATLEHLDLSGNQLTNQDLARLAEVVYALPGLQSLDLGCNRFDAEGFAALVKAKAPRLSPQIPFQRLQVLRADANDLSKVPPSTVSDLLRKCPELREISLLGCGLSEGLFSAKPPAASKLTTLGVSLNCSGSALEQKRGGGWGLCQRLVTLRLEQSTVTLQTLTQLLSTLEHCRVLSLRSTEVADHGALDLNGCLEPRGAELVSLDLSFCGLAAANVRSILASSYPNLETLSLAGNGLAGLAPADVARVADALPRLDSLDLSDCDLSGEVVCALLASRLGAAAELCGNPRVKSCAEQLPALVGQTMLRAVDMSRCGLGLAKEVAAAWERQRAGGQAVVSVHEFVLRVAALASPAKGPPTASHGGDDAEGEFEDSEDDWIKFC